MEARPRTARPGDICVLLEPAEEEIPRLRQLQASLQGWLGGHPHERVHLTCQRFRLEEDRLLATVVEQLRDRIGQLPPVALIANGVVIAESSFWQSRLLRWQVEVTEDLQRLVEAVEGGLVAAGARPHFPCAAGWIPALVTALEDVPQREYVQEELREGFPQYLFTGQRVVLSRIVGQRRFDVLSNIEWAE